MSMDEAATLIAALESAVAYLRRLPVVPATVIKIRELEGVLECANAKAFRCARRGQAFSPVGIPLLEAVLVNDQLTLRSDLTVGRAGLLWSAVAGEGVVLHLKANADCVAAETCPDQTGSS